MATLMFLLSFQQAFGLPGDQLMSLSDVSQISLRRLVSDRSVVVAFQPDCVPCKKQIRDLSCLDREYEVKLLGISATEKALRSEYIKMKSKYPAFYGSPEVLKQLPIGGDITPQIMLWQRGAATVLYGYNKCIDLKKSLQAKGSL